MWWQPNVLFGVGGSRAGGLIADCWAALIYYGREGYVSKVKDIVSTTRYIEKELRRVKGINIVGDPQVCIIAIGETPKYRISLHCSPNNRNCYPSQAQTCSTSTLCPTT